MYLSTCVHPNSFCEAYYTIVGSDYYDCTLSGGGCVKSNTLSPLSGSRCYLQTPVKNCVGTYRAGYGYGYGYGCGGLSSTACPNYYQKGQFGDKRTCVYDYSHNHCFATEPCV